jgi:hypothetical protein
VNLADGADGRRDVAVCAPDKQSRGKRNFDLLGFPRSTTLFVLDNVVRPKGQWRCHDPL